MAVVRNDNVDLKQMVSFDRCFQFYTAAEVCQRLGIPALTANRVGRFLKENSKETYVSRKGVKYLCRLNDTM